MKVYLFRHALTRANEERRYLGRTDEGLSEKGRASLAERTDLSHVKRVYISPMRRCAESARILFPHAEAFPVPDFREMDFGEFEMRTADEMRLDPAYTEWVNGMCEGRCPGGEDKAEFCKRTQNAFLRVLEQAEEGEPLVIVAHGGTIMAILSRFGVPQKPYWSWHTPAGGCICAHLETDGGIRLITEE